MTAMVRQHTPLRQAACQDNVDELLGLLPSGAHPDVGMLGAALDVAALLGHHRTVAALLAWLSRREVDDPTLDRLGICSSVGLAALDGQAATLRLLLGWVGGAVGRGTASRWAGEQVRDHAALMARESAVLVALEEVEGLPRIGDEALMELKSEECARKLLEVAWWAGGEGGAQASRLGSPECAQAAARWAAAEAGARRLSQWSQPRRAWAGAVARAGLARARPATRTEDPA